MRILFFLLACISANVVFAQTQKGEDIDGKAAKDFSGSSVSMPDNNNIAIGSDMNNGSAIESGHARVYSWNGTSWLQKGKDIDGKTACEYSGSSISISDNNIIAIGAAGNDANRTDAGIVRIYAWNGIAGPTSPAEPSEDEE